MARSSMWRRIGRGETYTLSVESYDDGSNHGYTLDDRPVFDWQIRDGLGAKVDSSTDDNDRIKLGVGDKIDAKKALASLTSFLLAAAEAEPDSENADLFCWATATWAEMHSDELQLLALDLEAGLER